MADDKTIYTEDGIPIPYLEKTVDNYLDKTTLIFGGSGSGKTTIIEEILAICKDHIPNCMVIAPKTSTKAYSSKLPARCIKENLSKEMIQNIWDRQVNLTQCYNIANDLNNLEAVFSHIKDNEALVMVRAMNFKANQCIDSIEANSYFDFAQKKAQKTAIEELKNKQIKELYKRNIRKHRATLEKKNLSTVEQVTLEFLDLNPRLMLIIDDCSEKIKAWMKMFKNMEDSPFEALFYRGRWNFITLIFASHDDKLIPTELRKGARITIFANSQALVASLNKQQSGYTTQEKKDATKMATRIFGQDPKAPGIKNHKKLCYVREDSVPFKYTIANLYPDFQIGGDSLRKLAEKLPSSSDSTKNNPYLNRMNN